MNPTDPESAEQQFAALLAQLDEALATGQPPDQTLITAAAPELRARLERAEACLMRMEQVWQRRERASGENTAALSVLHTPVQLGRFQVVRLLGGGGSGLVYLAWDPLLRREVAVKVPRPEAVLTLEARRRFLREAQVAAGLDHPHLVAVHEVGAVGPVVYIVSAYCPGPTLAAWLTQHRSPVPCPAAARLVAELAEAVEYIHQRGILHRDLKPGNILLARAGHEAAVDAETEGLHVPLGECVPKITDFGLAKDVQRQTQPTQSGTVLGTLLYMAPEQAAGRIKEVGPAADVYALGAILYELLTGRPPNQGVTDADTLHQVLTADPEPPRRLRPDVPHDLETVCLKCLEKEPRWRYVTAGQLAGDLRCHLEGRPTLARSAPRWRRALRWIKRRRALVAGIASGVLLLAVTAVGYRAYEKADRAEQERRRGMAWGARSKGLELCARGEVGPGLLWLAQALVEAPEAEADLQHLLRLDLGAWGEQTAALSAQLPHPDRFETGQSGAELSEPVRGGVGPYPDKTWVVQFSPDSRTALTLCFDGKARLWDADTGAPVGLPMPHPAKVLRAIFNADGQTVRTICQDGCVRTWALATGQLLRTEEAACAQGVPVGSRAALAADLLWEFATGQPPAQRLPDGSGTWLVSLSPDRKTALSVSYSGTVRWWDVATAQPHGAKLLPAETLIRDAAFRPDGAVLATAGIDKQVRFWDVAAQEERTPRLNHVGPVHALAFAPDGRSLFTGDTDTIRLWDAAGNPRLSLPRQGMIRTLAVSPDGRRLASGHSENGVRLWKLPERPPPPLKHPRGVFMTEVAGERGPEKVKLPPSGLLSVAFAPDGHRAVTGGADDAARFWDVPTGAPTGLLLRHDAPVRSIGFSPDGRTIVTGSRDKTARLWDSVTGQVSASLLHEGAVTSTVFSPDGTIMATGCLDGPLVRLWNPDTASCAAELRHPTGTFAVAFSPDGRTILTGCADKQAYLWDRATEQRRALPHASWVLAAAYSPDGHSFLTGTLDGTVRWWDAATGECRLALPSHAHGVWTVAYGPDGRVAATGGADRAVRFWDASTNQTVGPPRYFDEVVRSVAFHPNGRTMLVGCWDGQAWFLPVPQPVTGSPQQVRLWVQTLVGLELDREEVLRPLDAGVWRERRQRLQTQGLAFPMERALGGEQKH